MTDEELARRVAFILGPSCAAAKAISKLEKRRADGESVEIFQSVNNVGREWVVGPTPPSQGEGE